MEMIPTYGGRPIRVTPPQMLDGPGSNPQYGLEQDTLPQSDQSLSQTGSTGASAPPSKPKLSAAQKARVFGQVKDLIRRGVVTPEQPKK